MLTALKLSLVMLSIIGLADATYLTYEKLTGGSLVCGGGFDCGQVLTSPYSQIGPIPLSALGMMYYATVLVLASILVLQEKPSKLSFLSSLVPVSTIEAITLLTSTGFAFSIILVGIMGFVLKAWCFYCLISAGTSTLLFFGSLFVYYQANTQARSSDYSSVLGKLLKKNE